MVKLNKLFFYIALSYNLLTFGQQDTSVYSSEMIEVIDTFDYEDGYYEDEYLYTKDKNSKADSTLIAKQKYYKEPKKFENPFKDKYVGDEFDYNETESSKTLNLWQRFWRAVGEFFAKLFNTGSSNSTLSVIGVIFRILIFLILAFVIYMIVKLIINKEGGWIFGKNKKKILVSEMVEENIHTINFSEIIASSKSNKEYRIAIRYYYLWTLKKLSDNQIIEWDIEKTNADYMNEITKNELKKEFQYLSYVFEYSWYGEFDLNENDFKKAETNFRNFIAKN